MRSEVKDRLSEFYNVFSNEELIEKIVNEPHNEEAAVYLLYVRFNNAIYSVYKSFFNEKSKFDEALYDHCLEELFLLLRGKNGDWKALSSLNDISAFTSWIKKVSQRKFNEIIPKLIEIDRRSVSIDDETSDKPTIQIKDDSIDEERRLRRVMLLEAITQLKDEDQKFVVIKRLQGYDSREIAILLQKRWEKYGIVKYNNKKEPVIPDASYVDVRMQRAKVNLKKILIQYA